MLEVELRQLIDTLRADYHGDNGRYNDHFADQLEEILERNTQEGAQ